MNTLKGQPECTKPGEPATFLELGVWPGAKMGDAIDEAIFIVSTLKVAVRILWCGTTGFTVWPGDDKPTAHAELKRVVGERWGSPTILPATTLP